MMNMMNMMKQAQNIQKKLVDAQNELTSMSIEGTAGNGSVSVICDGKGQFKSIKLSAEAINPENPSLVSSDDIEMLEDLISSAMKTATEKSKSEMEAKMKSVTGGVNIPGLTL
ncbi:YbaB/EbfC family nucleoid-associated protein [bacterium]|nr:YbaB/EbfC family nucleoid-associated protein [bacterium]